MANSAYPDLLASSEASGSGSALFAKAEFIRVQQDKGLVKKKKHDKRHMQTVKNQINQWSLIVWSETAIRGPGQGQQVKSRYRFLFISLSSTQSPACPKWVKFCNGKLVEPGVSWMMWSDEVLCVVCVCV